MDSRISIILPWPPSVNKYWRRVGLKTLISREGREFREKVCGIIRRENQRYKLTDKLKVEIFAFPPDNRRRDIDNILKSSLDALTSAGVWKDDCLIDDLRVARRMVEPPGRIELFIERIKK